jgi:hypothetical protein
MDILLSIKNYQMYKLILLASSLIAQLVQAYRSHSRIKKKLKLLHTIIEIMPLTPTQLLSKLKDSPGS